MSIYGCWNKPRPNVESSYVAQSRWSETFRNGSGEPQRTPVYVDVKSAFDLSACKYTQQHASDPECSGCVHRAKGGGGMKIITRQSCADEVIEKWECIYGSGAWGEDKLVILRLLKQLPKPVDPNEVDRIIGNTSWTYTHHCSQCGQQSEVVIEVCQEPDYESATAWLCVPCVRKLAKFAEGL